MNWSFVRNSKKSPIFDTDNIDNLNFPFNLNCPFTITSSKKWPCKHSIMISETVELGVMSHFLFLIASFKPNLYRQWFYRDTNWKIQATLGIFEQWSYWKLWNTVFHHGYQFWIPHNWHYQHWRGICQALLQNGRKYSKKHSGIFNIKFPCRSWRLYWPPFRIFFARLV